MSRPWHAASPRPNRNTLPSFQLAPSSPRCFDVSAVAVDLAALERDRPELWLWEDTARATVLAVELPDGDQTLMADTLAGAVFSVSGPLPWEAVAMVGTGWATDEAGRRRCSITHVLDANGRQACALGHLPPTSHAPQLLVSEAGDSSAPSGRMTDALRRVVGLDTDPPPPTTDAFMSWAWERAVRNLVAEHCPPSWEAVSECHPAHRWAVKEGLASTTPEELAEAAGAYGARVSWDDLRLESTAGHHPALAIDPDLAEWCDDGLFARLFMEVAETYPELYTGPTPLLGPLTEPYLDVLELVARPRRWSPGW